MRRSQGGRPTLYARRELDVLPFSIGRDATCTIVLEDPNKHISRFHVEIEKEDGAFWMSVVSKVNPVMVKGRRYGPGTRLTLHSGDTFDIAEYQVQLQLPEELAEPEPPPEHAASAPPPADALSTGTQAPVAPPSSSADEAERMFNESTFFGGDQSPPKKMIPAPEDTFIPKKVNAPPAPRRAPAPTTAATRPAPAGAAALVRAFFEGAGLPSREIAPAESERMLQECGAIVRAAVEGIMMLLLARAELRKEFQAEERTMVAARDNNPLKLMGDPHEAMDFLFDPAQRTEGFLDPVQAVGDACEDLRSHEIALMAGMRAAIFGVLRRFDPQAIERAFEKDGQGFSLASRKSRLWDFFLEQQEKTSREMQEDFNKVFGREFMGAYQAQLRRMKGGKQGPA